MHAKSTDCARGLKRPGPARCAGGGGGHGGGSNSYCKDTTAGSHDETGDKGEKTGDRGSIASQVIS